MARGIDAVTARAITAPDGAAAADALPTAEQCRFQVITAVVVVVKFRVILLKAVFMLGITGGLGASVNVCSHVVGGVCRKTLENCVSFDLGELRVVTIHQGRFGSRMYAVVIQGRV
mmetsp:Transcript_89651/g.145207  ORF Transcript_89651/g.145207 Transcript_89651/m.145207 type:complete len:116 (-) Transcript_89651:2-349(-)